MQRSGVRISTSPPIVFAVTRALASDYGCQGVSCPQVTINAARAISIDDRAGSLRPGLPADVTIFRIDEGDVELSDCQLTTRKGNQTIVPVITFKNGVRFDADMTRCQDEKNWFWQISKDVVPDLAGSLDGSQKNFLGALAEELKHETWKNTSAERLDIYSAINLQDLFHEVRARSGLPLKEALEAVYACFVEAPFTMQIGLLLFRLDKEFALERLHTVTGHSQHVAAG